MGWTHYSFKGFKLIEYLNSIITSISSPKERPNKCKIISQLHAVCSKRDTLRGTTSQISYENKGLRLVDIPQLRDISPFHQLHPRISLPPPASHISLIKFFNLQFA